MTVQHKRRKVKDTELLTLKMCLKYLGIVPRVYVNWRYWYWTPDAWATQDRSLLIQDYLAEAKTRFREMARQLHPDKSKVATAENDAAQLNGVWKQFRRLIARHGLTV